MVVAQWTERVLLKPVDPSLDPVVSNFNEHLFSVSWTENVKRFNASIRII